MNLSFSIDYIWVYFGEILQGPGWRWVSPKRICFSWNLGTLVSQNFFKWIHNSGFLDHLNGRNLCYNFIGGTCLWPWLIRCATRPASSQLSLQFSEAGRRVIDSLLFHPETKGIDIWGISAFSFPSELIRFCYGNKEPLNLITYNSKHLFFCFWICRPA